MNKALPGVVLLAFGGLTVAAVLQHGYVGIFQYQLQDLAGLQVLGDPLQSRQLTVPCDP